MSAALPKGWAWIAVEDLAGTRSDITDGPFGSNLKTEHYTAFGPRVIRLQNIGDGVFVDEVAHIAESHFENLRKHEARPGDVIVAMLGEHLPKACLVPEGLGEAIVKADCVRLRPNAKIANPRFITFGLNSEVLRRQADALRHGVGRPRLGLKWFRTLRFPLAPLQEQERIADSLDSFLSRLDAAVAGLERAKEKLKAYRASILKAAVEGRLVPTEAELTRVENREYEPGDILLKRILAERRRRWEQGEAAGKMPNDVRWKARYGEPSAPAVDDLPHLPEGWCWASVEQVGDVLLGRQRAPQYLTGRWSRPYLRVANIKDDRVDLGDVQQMDFDDTHFAKYRLQPGDILVSEGQSPHLCGQSAIYRGGVEGLCFQKTLHRFRAVSGGPTPEFAQVVFRANVRLGVYKAVASITTNIAHLTLEKFKESRFPLPPAAEQERIVREVQRLDSIADSIERQLEIEKTRVQRLRQGILAWAFEGRLVNQEPNDEPAAQLLDRIRAGRTTPARKSRASRASRQLANRDNA